MTSEIDEAWRRKATIRVQAENNRRAQPDKDALSRRICASFADLTVYSTATTVLCYVGVRDEVRTRDSLAAALGNRKRVVVPYCTGGHLELFHLKSMDELAQAGFGLLEPKPELRQHPERRVDIGDIDLVMVPGLAFDVEGGRLGHGKGYYDKLLRQARPDTLLVAVAFQCQLFAEVPMLPHDVFMDRVVTEKAVYEGKVREG